MDNEVADLREAVRILALWCAVYSGSLVTPSWQAILGPAAVAAMDPEIVQRP